MDIHCNADTAMINLVGDLPGHRVVRFHPHIIANILSLTKIFANNHVIFDSKTGNKYFIKRSRPDIANAVGKLSRCISAHDAAAYKELLGIIKYVVDTLSKGLKVKTLQFDE